MKLQTQIVGPAQNDTLDVGSIEEYSEILKYYGLPFKETGYHLQVGEITGVEGWILHISIVRSQILACFQKVIPILIRHNMTFSIIRDKLTARNMQDGFLGHSQIGKIIKIYPSTTEIGVELIKELEPVLGSFDGPEVLTDFRLTNAIYTRFGGFNPIISLDANGNERRFIHFGQAELVEDIYHIPAILPRSIDWPFKSYKISPIVQRRSILKGIYKPISVLKSDAKGSVLKCLYVKNIINLKWCVIKEGRKNMWSDDEGRCMRDRLIWQKELYEKLSAKVRFPKVVDFFEEDGNTYFAMEFIKGRSLLDQVGNLNPKNVSWLSLTKKNRLAVLDYALQVVDIVKRLHNNGYVHRDITPGNFLVSKHRDLVLIDAELTYSIGEEKPEPPFQAGTAGFMSPEQIRVASPTPAEDIYALGSSLIVLIVGLSPIVFSDVDSDRLLKKISFFCGDLKLAHIIVNCWDSRPSMRPSINAIENAIADHKNKIIKNKNDIPTIDKTYCDINHNDLKQIINGGIRGLIEPPTLFHDGKWLSEMPKKDQEEGIGHAGFCFSYGLYEGVSGILYVLAKAVKCNFDISACKKAYYEGWNYIRNTFFSSLPNAPAGLYGGAAGIALSLAAGIQSGCLIDSSENRKLIGECLNIRTEVLNLANGVAGQGVAAMLCKDYLASADLQRLLAEYVTPLLAMDPDAHSAKNRNHAAGFSYGSSGLLWSLLEYMKHYPNQEHKAYVLLSLGKMEKRMGEFKKILSSRNIRPLVDNTYLLDEMYGLILDFIKAYEIFRIEKYKTLAEDVLIRIPFHLLHNNFEQDFGLSAVGEIYLEAYVVFDNKEWLDRASWITNILMHTCIGGGNDSYYWLSKSSSYSTADMMVGNSGIVYYLMRYLTPSKLGFRMLK